MMSRMAFSSFFPGWCESVSVVYVYVLSLVVRVYCRVWRLSHVLAKKISCYVIKVTIAVPVVHQDQPRSSQLAANEWPRRTMGQGSPHIWPNHPLLVRIGTVAFRIHATSQIRRFNMHLGFEAGILSMNQQAEDASSPSRPTWNTTHDRLTDEQHHDNSATEWQTTTGHYWNHHHPRHITNHQHTHQDSDKYSSVRQTHDITWQTIILL